MKVENLEIPEPIKQKYLDSGITNLNPPQRQAVEKGLLDGDDIIVASPTASGKTLIAELAITEKVVKKGGKAVYIVPLKALASEKYEDFSERFEDQEVMMAVGDRDDAGEYFETADIIVVTSEKLDSMLRHNPSWIHEIELVAVDEIHLLTSKNRGPTLEVTLTRLRDLLDFQLLGLSATISNSNEMADWLDSELVESNYRPVDLSHGVYWDNEIEFYPSDESSDDTNNDKDVKSEDINSSFSTGKDIKSNQAKEVETESYFIEDEHGRGVLNITEDTLDKEKQCIIFCSSRKGAEKNSDRLGKVVEPELNREERRELKEYGERIGNVLGSPTTQCERLAENVKTGAAFHHAGLLPEQRKLVEEAFRKGLIKTVSATPTLAAGINLPAFRVIIRDLKRYTGKGMEYIPVLEYEQMCLPYNEKILLSNGERKPIGEIVESNESYEVLSFNKNTKEVEGKKVINKFKNGSKDIIEIETGTGSISLTPDHPILVKQNSEDKWVEAENLQKSDLVRISPGKTDFNDSYFFKLLTGPCYTVGNGAILTKFKKEFNLTDEEIAEKLEISSSTVYHYRNNKKAVPLKGILKACNKLGLSNKEISDRITHVKSGYGNTIEIPKKINKDFMWLLGLILTDGNLNKTEDKRTRSTYTSIRVYNTNKEIIEKAKTVFNSLGLECYEAEVEDGKYRLEVGNTLLAKIINEKFSIPYGNKSQKTQIPERIFRMSENLQAGFIEGVFDGDGSFLKMEDQHKRRVHFSTSSEDFADDLRDLLASFGVKSRKDSTFIEDLKIKGKKYEVGKESYSVRIRSKDSINKLSDLISPVKEDISKEEYSNYQNSNKHRRNASNYTEILDINQVEKEKEVYNIEVEDNNTYLTGSREILHNCGRAGRPKYDDHGEAISISKNSGMKSEIVERYIQGEAERIQSKLNAEPILRMHTLSLIASSFCTSMEELQAFYKKTFYAYQFGDMSEVERNIKEVVKDLREYGFIKENELKPTQVGRRVSELYIDPDSAHHILQCLKRAENSETRPISYLFMLSRTTEMSPRLRVKEKEYSDIGQELMDAEPYLLETIPNEWDPDYDLYLECMKTSMMMQGWISEVDEDRLMDKYGIAPGGIRAKTRNADWLLYASKELARMKDIPVKDDVEKLRLRLQYGIDKELLDLVKFDQIGRIRARKLYDHGIRDKEGIREVSFEKLKKLIGKRTAEKLKKQVGEENVFDRENIMDYFE